MGLNAPNVVHANRLDSRRLQGHSLASGGSKQGGSGSRCATQDGRRQQLVIDRRETLCQS